MLRLIITPGAIPHLQAGLKAAAHIHRQGHTAHPRAAALTAPDQVQEAIHQALPVTLQDLLHQDLLPAGLHQAALQEEDARGKVIPTILIGSF